MARKYRDSFSTIGDKENEDMVARWQESIETASQRSVTNAGQFWLTRRTHSDVCLTIDT